MHISVGLMTIMRQKAGNREHEILNNLVFATYRHENGYRIIHCTDRRGNSAEFSLKLMRWTN